jgi:hypothetical protein
MELQARELEWGLSVNKWSDVKCRDGGSLTWWSDVVMKISEVKWSDVMWSESVKFLSMYFILQAFDYIVAMSFR